MTIMVINKTDSDLISNLTIQKFVPQYPAAKVYQYSRENWNSIINLPDIPLQSNPTAGQRCYNDILINGSFPANRMVY